MNERDVAVLSGALARRVASTVREARQDADYDAVLAAMARRPATTGECPHRAAAKRRYSGSNFATMIRESRAAMAAAREELDCGQQVLSRRGSVDEFLACRR